MAKENGSLTVAENILLIVIKLLLEVPTHLMPVLMF